MQRSLPLFLTKEQYYISSENSLQMHHNLLVEAVEVHWHEFYEIEFVLSGEGLHFLNGKKLPLHKGCICLLTPADFHELRPNPGSRLEIFNIIFSADLLFTEVYSLLYQHLSAYQTALEDEQFCATQSEVLALFRELSEKQFGYQRIAVGILERILISLVRRFLAEEQEEQVGSEHDEYVQLRPALLHIHHHFREHLTLEEVARQVHLSPNYFSECFRRTCGISFQHYVQDLRLHFARSLLLSSKLPITAICYAAGFNNLSYFGRAFKHKFGISPRECVSAWCATEDRALKQEAKIAPGLSTASSIL